MEVTIYNCIEEITGLSRSDFIDYQDVDLIDSGILDSLCLVSLMESVSDSTGKIVTLNDFERDDFINIGIFINRMKKILC